MKKKELRALQDQFKPSRVPETPSRSVTVITIQMPTRDVVEFAATDVTIEFNRDFMDATTRYSPMKTYVVGPRTFTIKGTM